MNYFKEIISTNFYFKDYIDLDYRNPNFKPLLEAAFGITYGALKLDSYVCSTKIGCYELDLVINGKQVLVWIEGDSIINHRGKTKLLNDILLESDYEGEKGFFYDSGSFRDLVIAFITVDQYDKLVDTGLMNKEELNVHLEIMEEYSDNLPQPISSLIDEVL